MKRKEALNNLLAKVEAGVDCTHSFAAVYPCGSYSFTMMVNPFSGSLDAAMALHEAVLPGWPYTINENGAWTDSKRGLRRIGFKATSRDNPARAWLCAILKALIAQEEAKP